MRIIFIRHGDPDYVNDTLTEKVSVKQSYYQNVLLHGIILQSSIVLLLAEHRKQHLIL